MAHSPIAPSSAGIWGAPNGCTGSVKLAALYPEREPSEASREGDAVHEVGAHLIEIGLVTSLGVAPRLGVGDVATNGVVITLDMLAAATMYAEDVLAVARRARVFGGPNVGIEQALTMPRIHPESHGTTDSFLYDERHHNLFIWDLKNGYGVVEPFENWQEINYFEGIMNHLGLDGLDDQKITVHFRIVQPNAPHREGPIRGWVTNAADLRGYVNTLHDNAAIALGSNAPLHSGTHCKNCNARRDCPAAIAAGLSMYEIATQTSQVGMTTAQLGAFYRMLIRAEAQIKCLKTGVGAEVEYLLRHGTNVPGAALEHKSGNLAWNRPLEEVAALGDMMGVELRTDKLITPTQARAAGLDASLVSAYAGKRQTGAKVVLVDYNNVRKAFTS